MTTPEQAEKIAESLIEEPRKALRDRQQAHVERQESARRRRESPLLPVAVAVIGAVVASNFLDSYLVIVPLGIFVGALFALVARLS